MEMRMREKSAGFQAVRIPDLQRRQQQRAQRLSASTRDQKIRDRRAKQDWQSQMLAQQNQEPDDYILMTAEEVEAQEQINSQIDPITEQTQWELQILEEQAEYEEYLWQVASRGCPTLVCTGYMEEAVNSGGTDLRCATCSFTILQVPQDREIREVLDYISGVIRTHNHTSCGGNVTFSQTFPWYYQCSVCQNQTNPDIINR